MIFTGFEPNVQKDMLCTAWKFLLWKLGSWKVGKETELARAAFSHAVGGASVVFFDSGRSSLWAILKARGIGEGSEVIVQGYTCMVVANAIRKAGATPVYVDIGSDLNMDPTKIAEKISPKTKAIIIQHTFGNPADLDAILPIAKSHGLFVIEDSAHVIGGTYKGKKLGTFGDATMWSFGSDKSVSAVRGGAATTRDSVLLDKLQEIEAGLPHQSHFKIKSHLQHPIMFQLGKATYNYFFGKALLAFCKATKATSLTMEATEKMGKAVKGYPAKFPNALAALLLSEIPHLEARNAHRVKIAGVYKRALGGATCTEREGIIPLRFFVTSPKRDQIFAAMKGQGIMLGDWWDGAIAPKGSLLEAAGYTPGSCPVAEKIASGALNLPIHEKITPRVAAEIAEKIKKLL